MKNYSSLRNPCSGEISERAPVDRACSQTNGMRDIALVFSVHVRYMLSPVRLSVCLSVTLVHPTQVIVIFGNISTALATLAIR